MSYTGGALCLCGAILTPVTTNRSETIEYARPDPLVTTKINLRCHNCHAEVTIVHHSGDDPLGFTTA